MMPLCRHVKNVVDLLLNVVRLQLSSPRNESFHKKIKKKLKHHRTKIKIASQNIFCKISHVVCLFFSQQKTLNISNPETKKRIIRPKMLFSSEMFSFAVREKLFSNLKSNSLWSKQATSTSNWPQWPSNLFKRFSFSRFVPGCSLSKLSTVRPLLEKCTIR